MNQPWDQLKGWIGVEIAVVVAMAAVISAGIIVILLPLLRRYALAHPNARSSHRQSTPQGAGIAVIASAIGVTLATLVSGLPSAAYIPTSLWLLFAAAIFIAVVGAIDDVWTMAVVPRLVLQALAVGIMVASLPAELRVVAQLPWWIERAVVFIACLWFVNLTNFMDGIDWMTVAEFVPVALGLTILGLLGALPAHVMLVAVALAGGLIGFAPFNRPVARIFLGDVGSLPIGLLFGWLLVLVASGGHPAAALLLPLYYLADATLTLFWRLARQEPFWQAHRTHFYQVATDRGFRVAEIVGRVFAVNLALIALAVATVVWPGPLGSALALACGAALVGWLLYSFARGRS